MIKSNKCIGCGLCAASCPNHCIVLIDKSGFYLPVIDKTKCVDCGLCHRVCSDSLSDKHLQKRVNFYVAQNNNEIELKSSSGGVFYSLAEETLKENGAVYAARLVKENDKFVCRHEKMNNNSNIIPFLGSKYIQSVCFHCFKEIKKDLIGGTKVLFVGTPCQISALRIYLKQEYDNLVCVDLFCYGYMSNDVFNRYLKYLEASYKSNVCDVFFRKKINNGTYFYVAFENGKFHKEGSCDNAQGLMKAFAKTITIRNSCLNCRFKRKERVGDISLGDFPFSEVLNCDDEQIDRARKTSLVSLNTKKGIELFDRISLQKALYPDYIESKIVA